MSIEIIKENINIEELKGQSEVQTLVETEIYLNTIKENIKEIIWTEGRIDITNTMIIKDKILVNGLVKFNLVYKSEEENIHSLDSIKDFNVEMFIKGLREDMIPTVESNIEFIEEELKENKLELRAVINLNGEVVETKTLEVIQGIEGRDDLEVLSENIKYEEVYGRGQSQLDIREMFHIGEGQASIERVIKFFVETREIESAVTEDRIILSGEALITLIYVADNELYSIKETIPFNHFLDLPEVEEGAQCEIKLSVIEAIYDVMEDEVGEQRLVDVEIKLGVSGRAYDENTKDLIIDAYSTEEEIILEKEEINIPEKIDKIEYNERVNLEAPINAIDILDIRREHSIIDKKITEEGVIIEGAINVVVYYIDRIGGEIANFIELYPYTFTIPYEGEDRDLSIVVTTRLADIDYSIKRDAVLIENNVYHSIVLSKKRWIYGIRDIQGTGNIIDKSNMPSITIYIVQEGDLLWDIAKRYNTTAEDILSSNNLEVDYELQVGDKIIIEKKLDLDF
ncbi:MAG TPA: SPOCS domain-containing protein [Tissierellaceae bacterium]|nr:SPOCS domain-containing protein [Tissierellaceae bacterium]